MTLRVVAEANRGIEPSTIEVRDIYSGIVLESHYLGIFNVQDLRAVARDNKLCLMRMEQGQLCKSVYEFLNQTEVAQLLHKCGDLLRIEQTVATQPTPQAEQDILAGLPRQRELVCKYLEHYMKDDNFLHFLDTVQEVYDQKYGL